MPERQDKGPDIMVTWALIDWKMDREMKGRRN